MTPLRRPLARAIYLPPPPACSCRCCCCFQWRPWRLTLRLLPLPLPPPPHTVPGLGVSTGPANFTAFHPVRWNALRRSERERGQCRNHSLAQLPERHAAAVCAERTRRRGAALARLMLAWLLPCGVASTSSANSAKRDTVSCGRAAGQPEGQLSELAAGRGETRAHLPTIEAIVIARLRVQVVHLGEIKRLTGPLVLPRRVDNLPRRVKPRAVLRGHVGVGGVNDVYHVLLEAKPADEAPAADSSEESLDSEAVARGRRGRSVGGVGG